MVNDNLLNKDIKIVSIYITAPTTDTVARAQLRDPSGYKKTLEKIGVNDDISLNGEPVSADQREKIVEYPVR